MKTTCHQLLVALICYTDQKYTCWKFQNTSYINTHQSWNCLTPHVGLLNKVIKHITKTLATECPWLSSLFSGNIHCFFILTIKIKLRTLTNKCFKNINECQVISCNNFTQCFKIKNVSHNLQSAFEARILIWLFELSLLVVSCNTLQGWRLLTQFCWTWLIIRTTSICWNTVKLGRKDLALALIALDLRYDK